MNKQAEHKCEGTEEMYQLKWDEIYCDNDGNWIFSADADESRTVIHFCPFCGMKLEKMEALPRPEPKAIVGKPLRYSDVDFAKANKEISEAMSEAFQQESNIHKLFKK